MLTGDFFYPQKTITMCGIRTVMKKTAFSVEEKEKLKSDFKNIQRRGPDISIFKETRNTLLGFHRLAIMDLSQA